MGGILRWTGLVICGLIRLNPLRLLVTRYYYKVKGHQPTKWIQVDRLTVKLCVVVQFAAQCTKEPSSSAVAKKPRDASCLSVVSIELPALRRKAATDKLVAKIIQHDSWPIQPDILSPP